MSVTQATVTSIQVAVRCQRNVGSLLIDMSIDTWLIYQSRCVGRVSDEISADNLCWLTCRLTHHDQHISRESVNMSTDISVEHQSICRPTVDRYVRRHVD